MRSRRRARSTAPICVNSTPMPSLLFEYFTVPSMRISPSGSEKRSLIEEPCARGVRVEMKTPPRLKSRTRETEGEPSVRQATQSPFEVSTRGVRRFSCACRFVIIERFSLVRKIRDGAPACSVAARNDSRKEFGGKPHFCVFAATVTVSNTPGTIVRS